MSYKLLETNSSSLLKIINSRLLLIARVSLLDYILINILICKINMLIMIVINFRLSNLNVYLILFQGFKSLIFKIFFNVTLKDRIIYRSN